MAVLIAAGCAGGTPSGPPGAVPFTMPMPTAPPTGATQPVGHRSLGTGRALAAAAGRDVVVIVTTTGVYAASPGQPDPVLLGSFTERVGNVDVAVSPDGTSAAVLLGHPASVRMYDLSGATPVAVAQLGDGQVATVAFAPNGALIAQGPNSLLAWPDGLATPPVVLSDGVALGRAAVLADARVVVPARGTDELFVGPLEGPLAPQVVAGVADGTLADAATSPSGGLVVSIARGTDEFSRTDDLAWIDPAGWTITATGETGIRTEALTWAAIAGGAAVAGESGTTVYSAAGTLVGTAPGGSIAVMATSTGFATIGVDGSIAFWSPADLAAPIASVAGPPLVGSARVDAERVAVVGFYGHVAVWDAATGASTYADDRFATGELTSLAVSDDGWVMTGSSLGTAAVYNGRLDRVGTIDEGPRRIDAVGFVPGSHDPVTALAARVGEFAFDDSVARWSGADLTETFRVAGEGQDVAGCAFFYNRVRFSPDGSLLAIVRHTFEVELVDVATGALVHTFPPHGAAVFDVAFDDAGHLITTADDTTVRVWNVSDFTSAAEYASAPGGYTSVTPLGGGAMAVTGVVGYVSVVDVLSGAARGELPTSATRAGRPASSPDGSMLAVPALDGSVGVWSVATSTLLTTLTGPAGPVSELVFADATTLLGASQDGSLHEWTLGV